MPSNFKVHIRAELKDRDGKLIKRYPWVKANSLLKQFAQVLAVQMGQAAISIKRSNNADYNLSPEALAFRSTPGAGATTWGILIGSGTTPVAMTDIVLQTPVVAGVTHGAQTVAVENPDANTYRVAISRTFTNATGASLGIREVGWTYLDGGGTPYFLLDHTLYSVDVANGLAVTLTYRITISL